MGGGASGVVLLRGLGWSGREVPQKSETMLVTEGGGGDVPVLGLFGAAGNHGSDVRVNFFV